ncbi:FUSC family protein [Pseudoduganella umbonata]|uniref:FUSC family protein n=1 Tax=Pseudoduganella umbonata TaxID=864828 RepID=A0A4P8HIJ2_9BURK|nr:FUSC family protein [Pseudoduganella umbonata]MBB3225149.1 putative membrane protein YccC [Pseudoduganella umbonata]QCP09317.1 FUSC family protein [Pseudoduganella umbonata]
MLPAYPQPRELLFSAKCFAASMLALYVSMAAGLPRPFWAMMTAYIVASPLAGAVRSKAIFRVCGTLAGSAATVALVPNLANAPELLSLALACWVAACLYVSLLDRTPRSYIFMLAGYTAGLIGFPAVADPASVFDTAIARVEEIGIGILSATLVHSLVFPQGVGPALLGRLDRAIGDARRWMLEAVHSVQPGAGGQHGPATRDTHVRLALAAEISDMRIMSTHLPFDTSHLRWTGAMVHALHDRLAVMVPLLLAVEDRLQALAEDGPVEPAWQAMLDDVAQWIGEGRAADPARAAALRARLDALAPPLAPDAAWRTILQVNLAQRLAALVRACQESLELRDSIDAVMHGEPPSAPPHLTPSVLHRDHGMALRSALAAAIAILACCAFWILTGWPAGAAAPMLAGVACCFFATMDDPVPAITGFVKYTLWSVPVSAFYILVVLPAVHSYEMLVLTLAPVFLLLGVYMARPATYGNALTFVIGIASTLALQDTNQLDMASFANGLLAQLAGYIAAALVTRTIRTVDAPWMARRMLKRARAELVQLARAPRAPALLEVSARVVDRVALLMPRLALAKAAPEVRAAALENIRELRVGLHIAQLRGLAPQLEPRGVPLAALLQQLAAHFAGASAARTGSGSSAAHGLLAQLDATLRAVCRSAGGQGDGKEQATAAAALASMRRDLFPHAASYQPFSDPSTTSR